VKGKREMKKKKKYKTIILILGILFAVPFNGLAADTWNETPDLKHELETEPVESEPVRLIHVNPSIEMLAETPDLLAGDNEGDTQVHKGSNKAAEFKPEMYMETSPF
jgi:hypothetical protein